MTIIDRIVVDRGGAEAQTSETRKSDCTDVLLRCALLQMQSQTPEVIFSNTVKALLQRAFDLRRVSFAYLGQVISAGVRRKSFDNVLTAYRAQNTVVSRVSLKSHLLMVTVILENSIKAQHCPAPLYPQTKSEWVRRASLFKILIAMLFIANLDKSFAGSEFNGPYSAEVLRVVDGDTMVARVHVWPDVYAEVSVRLKGVDTPETRRARCPAERELGKRATEFSRAQLAARPVTLRDLSNDKYGRTAARVFVGDEDLAALLIAQGLARAYDGGRRAGWCEGAAGR